MIMLRTAVILTHKIFLKLTLISSNIYYKQQTFIIITMLQLYQKQKNLKFIKKISDTHNSTVIKYKYITQKQNQSFPEFIAIKICPKIDFAQQQIAIMSQIKHQNIISLLDHRICQQSQQKKVFIMMPCADYSLAQQINIKSQKNQKFSIQQILSYAKQIASGLNTLHNKNLAHLDIKPQNILIYQQKQIKTVKIADFGISRQISINQGLQTTQNNPCSKWYMSPQRAFNKKGLCIDIWAFGIVLFELCASIRINKIASSAIKVEQTICEYQLQPKYTIFLQLIKDCFKNHDIRIKINEILKILTKLNVSIDKIQNELIKQLNSKIKKAHQKKLNETPDLLIRRANQYKKQYKYFEAIQDLKFILKNFTHKKFREQKYYLNYQGFRRSICIELIDLYKKLNLNSEIKIIYDELLKLNPSDIDIYVEYAIYYRNRKMYQNSQQLLKKAIEINPNSKKSLCNYAQLLSLTSRFKQAIQIYNQILNLKIDLQTQIQIRKTILDYTTKNQ